MDKEFIKKIKHLEVDSPLKRGEIADKMELSGATISNYFNGYTDPSSDTKDELIDILEKSIAGELQ